MDSAPAAVRQARTSAPATKPACISKYWACFFGQSPSGRFSAGGYDCSMNNTFRLSQGQIAHTLVAIGAAIAQANPSARGEYIRLTNVISQGCAPQTGGSYELGLTAAQAEQVSQCISTARSIDNTPPEWGRWMTELDQVFQTNQQTAGASGG